MRFARVRRKCASGASETMACILNSGSASSVFCWRLDDGLVLEEALAPCCRAATARCSGRAGRSRAGSPRRSACERRVSGVKNWQLRYCLAPSRLPFSAPWPAGENSDSRKKMPGTYMRPMLRRSTLGRSSRTTFLWNGGGGASMCQRSTRKPSSRRSIGERLGLEGVLLRAAERLRVHEGEVREVGQVVDDQQVVRVVVHVVRHAAPARVAQVRDSR